MNSKNLKNTGNLLDCISLKKSYQINGKEQIVIDKITLTLQAGQNIALWGESGAGKSTLLYLLGGLDRPSSGKILWENINIEGLSEKKRCQKRNSFIGFIYQFHYLIEELTVSENVLLPLKFSQKENKEEDAIKILKRLGLENHLNQQPKFLSGGEKQRVAIARALITSPAILLADEPSGNLDQKNTKIFWRYLLELQQKTNVSLLLATHNEFLANQMDQVIEIEKRSFV